MARPTRQSTRKKTPNKSSKGNSNAAAKARLKAKASRNKAANSPLTLGRDARDRAMHERVYQEKRRRLKQSGNSLSSKSKALKDAGVLRKKRAAKADADYNAVKAKVDELRGPDLVAPMRSAAARDAANNPKRDSSRRQFPKITAKQQAEAQAEAKKKAAKSGVPAKDQRINKTAAERINTRPKKGSASGPNAMQKAKLAKAGAKKSPGAAGRTYLLDKKKSKAQAEAKKKAALKRLNRPQRMR